MKTPVIVLFTSTIALSVGVGVTSMLMLRAGVMQKPETVIVTRWAIPPNPTAPPPILPTPLTATEQLRLQEAIKCPYVPPRSPLPKRPLPKTPPKTSTPTPTVTPTPTSPPTPTSLP